jgi:hypothetical protein
MTIHVTSLVRRRGGAVVLAFALVACDVNDLLDVPDPDVATPLSVQDKSALPAVLAGAQGDYMVAYNGNASTNMVTGTALLTDEMIHAETFPTRIEFDQRNINANTNTDLETVFRNLHRARLSASRAAQGYEKFDATNPGYAEALNLEGMSYVLFGEAWCNGVAFSSVDNAGNQSYGGPITIDSMFGAAIVRFDSAIKVLGTNATAAATLQLNFARVGKARAMLNRAQTPADAAAAAAIVTAVPTTFTYDIAHSDNTARQNNGTFALVYDGRRFSVANNEGGNGLSFVTDSSDSRVRSGRGTGNNAFGFDGSTALFQELKMPLRTSAITVANGIEARLIEAESDLRAGGVAWVTTLNTLRTSNITPALPGNIAASGNATTDQNTFFKERAYWLWLTSHRLGDMRRLIRQYGRTVATVFPTGAYFKGGTYGGDVNFPIWFDEKNNPEFNGQPANGFCIDRNP